MAGFNALSAGIVMGIMIIPFVSSLSEDALQANTKSLKNAAYGLGSTRFQTSFRVMVPGIIRNNCFGNTYFLEQLVRL